MTELEASLESQHGTIRQRRTSTSSEPSPIEEGFVILPKAENVLEAQRWRNNYRVDLLSACVIYFRLYFV